MPFSPYSTPLQFEYKPLGLERFAEPLAQMQQQYDMLSTDIQKPTYAIQSLPGTDEAKATALQAHYDKQRDEMASNLLKNRNTRGVAKQIAELNQIHTSHPEIQAMQGNLQQYQTYAKEQKERVDKGKISEDEYKKNISNAMSLYESKKGLNYDYSTGNYNQLNFKSLSDDLRPEMNERLDALTKMTAAEKRSWAKDAGVNMERFTRISKTGSHEYINESELDNILRGTIMSDPRYLKSISDRKELDLDYNKYNRPDVYQNELSNAIEVLSKNPNSPTYHQLQDAISNDDQNMVEQIARSVSVANHSSNYVNKMIAPHTKAGAYDKWEAGRSEANLNAADLGNMGFGADGAKIPKTPVAGFVPIGESTPITNVSLNESSSKTKGDMVKTVENLHINSGKEFNKVFKNDLDKGNYYQLGDESKKILNAFDKSGGNSFEKFKANYKGSAKPEDLKQLYWNLALDPNKLTNFKNSAGTMSVLATKLKTDQGIIKQSNINIQKDPLYIKEENALANEPFMQAEGFQTKDLKTSADKILNKAVEDNKTVNITPLMYAKAAGFNTIGEFFKSGKKLPTYNDFSIRVSAPPNTKLTDLRSKFIDKDLQSKSYFSVFQVQGTTAVDKALQASTNTYLDQVVGLKGENLKGMKDVDGNDLMSNEKLEGGIKNGTAMLGKDSYGRIAIVVPYKLKDGSTINLFTKPKQGIESDGNLKRIAKNIYNSASTKADLESSSELLFDLEHPNNPVNNFYIDPLETTSDKPVTVYEYKINGVPIKIVKESLKSSDNKKETANQSFIAYGYSNGVWQPIEGTKTTDIHLVKSKLGSLYAN